MRIQRRCDPGMLQKVPKRPRGVPEVFQKGFRNDPGVFKGFPGRSRELHWRSIVYTGRSIGCQGFKGVAEVFQGSSGAFHGDLESFIGKPGDFKWSQVHSKIVQRVSGVFSGVLWAIHEISRSFRGVREVFQSILEGSRKFLRVSVLFQGI